MPALQPSASSYIVAAQPDRRHLAQVTRTTTDSATTSPSGPGGYPHAVPSTVPLLTLPRATRVSPFLKWLGGKRWLIDQGIRVPQLRDESTYYEPFLGAGSLFFALKPPRAVLTDINPELTTTFNVVRDAVEDVIGELDSFENTEETYLRVRAEMPNSEIGRAVRFIYLNRTAYGGMYRVNARGEFNVPYGRYDDRRICQPVVLREASKALSTAQISPSAFAEPVKRARLGDFVYFDPPYDSRSSRELFARYTNSAFTWEMHKELATIAVGLADRGVHVLVSNTAHPDVCDLYSDFHCNLVKRRTQLSSDPTRRGLVQEAVFASYPGALPD